MQGRNDSGSQYPNTGSGGGTGESQYPSSGSQYPNTGSGGGFGGGGNGGGFGGWGFPPPSWGSPHPPSPQMFCSPPQPQRNVSRTQSFFGDYRPNMDAVNSPVVDSGSPILPTNLSEFENMSFDQMGITPGVTQTTAASAPVQGGGAPSGSGTKGKGRSRAEGGGPYTDAESAAVAKAWVSVSEDPEIGANQTEKSLWKRIAAAYEKLKPEGAVSRGGDQLRKKWDRIRGPVKRFSGIMENLHKTVESGRSEADLRNLASKMYKEDGKYSAFTCWDEYVVLKDSPKFRVDCETGDFDAVPKRTWQGVPGPYSSGGSGSGSGSAAPMIDLNQDHPPPARGRRRRPQGQQAAIRASRAAISVSASASTATSMPAVPGMTGALPQMDGGSELLMAQHQRNLLEALNQYVASPFPSIRAIYPPLIAQLCAQLGIPVPSLDPIVPPPPPHVPTPAPTGDSDDVVADSGDETEEE